MVKKTKKAVVVKKEKAQKKNQEIKVNWADFFVNALKGVTIGVANVIPGVSGGTMAVITGVFERLLFAIKSIDMTAIKMLLKLDIKGFAKQVDLVFLLSIGTGMAVAIVSVARLFKYLFATQPVLIWAFFFGLILPSVYYVARTVKKWNPGVVGMFAVGTVSAAALSLISPGVENANLFYVFLCGVISICAMILPGISGSFVLVLMGNYKLIVVQSISNMDFMILIPFLAGCAVGVIAFAHILTWILKKFHDMTVASLAGFVLGSLVMIWPWKQTVYLMDSAGAPLMRKGAMVVSKYVNVLPQSFNSEVVWVIVVALFGALVIWLTETMASKKK